MFQMFTDQIFLSRAGRLRQSKLVSWLELHLLITTRANVRGINLTSHLFCEDQGPETQLDEDCDKGFMMWRENVSVLSGSFDANMGLWFYSRFTWAQTSSLVYLDLMLGPGTIICWELFRLRSVTREEDLFFVAEGRNLFSSFAPKLRREQQRDFFTRTTRKTERFCILSIIFKHPLLVVIGVVHKLGYYLLLTSPTPKFQIQAHH